MSCAFGSNLVIVSVVLLIDARVPNEFACPLKGPTPGTLSVGSIGRIPKSTALNSVAGTRSDGESANTGNGAYYVAKITICLSLTYVVRHTRRVNAGPVRHSRFRALLFSIKSSSVASG